MRDADRDLWRQADAVLGRLLELPAAERAAALAAMELPEAVRERVATLLASDEQSQGPLDGEWLDHIVAAEPEAPDPLLGRVVGAFRLVERIGRGGMSVVYRAERCDGAFEQEVAVKLLYWHQLGSAGAARFRQEQQILARLRHPHIATLFDGGLVEDGTPYLVMERIDGEPIDAYCDRHSLAVGERVELVRQVCQAVGYAHRQLVVHRDIKPGNVLVEPGGRAKLLDFGIAKLLEGEGGELTRTGERLLTPEFAAPEQLLGEPVTTATDVFALGLLLHRLLTGEPAFPEGGRGRDPAATPPAPSRVLGRQAGPRVDDRRRRSAIDGDLDRIVLMALRPEPERRYTSAEDLGRDLDRWRRQLPVAATPDSLGYRLRTFAVRRRGTVAAAALVLAVGSAGLAATVWQARQTRQQAEQVLSESTRAQAVRDFLVELFEANDPDIAQGRMPTARDLLDQGAHQVRGAFAVSPDLHAEMLVLLGGLYRSVGEYEAARPLLEEGLALAEQGDELGTHVDALHGLGTLDMEVGRHDEALASLEQAERLLTAAGWVPGMRHAALIGDMALALGLTGRDTEAVERAETALALARADMDLTAEGLFDYLSALGDVLRQFPAQLDRAAALFREAIALDLVAADTPTRRWASHVGLLYAVGLRGDLEGSELHGREALAIAEAIYPPLHYRRAEALHSHSLPLLYLGRFEEAEAGLRQALEIYEAIFPDRPHPRAITARHYLGRVLHRAERFGDAEAQLALARDQAAGLFGRDDLLYATITAELGHVLRHTEHHRDGDELLHEASEIRRALQKEEPHLIAEMSLAAIAIVLADQHLAQGRPAEAFDLMNEVRGYTWQAELGAPYLLMFVQSRLARALHRLGRVEEAEAAFAEAIAIGEAAGRNAGVEWPHLLAAHAELLLEHNRAAGLAAIGRALEAHREIFGDAHPATQRMAALARTGATVASTSPPTSQRASERVPVRAGDR